MNKTIALTGIVFGLLAIMLGAFGAHGLQRYVDAAALESFEVGVRYQLYHALLLLVLATMVDIPEAAKKWVYYLIAIGTIMFSFSIYLLALNALSEVNFALLGPVTPIGGTLLITGWALLGYRVIQHFRR